MITRPSWWEGVRDWDWVLWSGCPPSPPFHGPDLAGGVSVTQSGYPPPSPSHWGVPRTGHTLSPPPSALGRTYLPPPQLTNTYESENITTYVVGNKRHYHWIRVGVFQQSSVLNSFFASIRTQPKKKSNYLFL